MTPYQLARQTPLMIAAGKGHRSMVALLLKAGADPNALDEGNQSPLAKAVMSNKPAVVALLLKAGSEPNLRWRGGDSRCDRRQRAEST